MATPQSGIFVEGSRFHHYLEYFVSDHFTARDVAQVLAARGVAQAIVALGNAVWGRLSSPAPGALKDFTAIEGMDGYTSPSAQRDLLIWFHAAEHDDVLYAALGAQRALEDVAEQSLHPQGFVYRDSRDMTGFIDGSANPKEDARLEAAFLPDDEASAGGAFVMFQKWVHDQLYFEAPPVPDQEPVIRRTKPDSIELEGDAMPPDSHVSRTDVKLDGAALKIYRSSAPFSGAVEKGLYFIAFSCDPMRFDVMLQRMFGTWEDNEHDHLIHYNTPTSGSYWFAPSEEDFAAAGCIG